MKDILNRMNRMFRICITLIATLFVLASAIPHSSMIKLLLLASSATFFLVYAVKLIFLDYSKVRKNFFYAQHRDHNESDSFFVGIYLVISGMFLLWTVKNIEALMLIDDLKPQTGLLVSLHDLFICKGEIFGIIIAALIMHNIIANVAHHIVQKESPPS